MYHLPSTYTKITLKMLAKTSRTSLIGDTPKGTSLNGNRESA